MEMLTSGLLARKYAKKKRKIKINGKSP